MPEPLPTPFVVTTTDVAHVPGAEEEDVVRLRVDGGVVTPEPIAA